MFGLFSLGPFGASFIAVVGGARVKWCCYSLVLLCLLIYIINCLCDYYTIQKPQNGEILDLQKYTNLLIYKKKVVFFIYRYFLAVLSLSFHLYAESLVNQRLHQCGHLFDGEFLQSLCGRGAVDGVDHDLAGAQLPHDCHPAVQHFGAR